MISRPRLYERAAQQADEFGPLWHVDAGRTFFVGTLAYNRPHQHGAPVYLAGIYGPFGLRLHGGDWLSCRTAVIPAGVSHELDLGNNPLAVFYIEPTVDSVGAFLPLIGDAREEGAALVGKSGEFCVMREVWEDPASARWISEALDDLLSFSRRRSPRTIDQRVSMVIQGMQQVPEERRSVTELAARVGLSGSRFQHLFTREVGVPFRRYRAWRRIRMGIDEIVRGGNFTQAAHAAGFADQAHFSHDFRRTFGGPPSLSLRKLRI